MPLVNEVVIPLGKKDRFNASEPADDAQFRQVVLDPELARLIPVLYPGVKVPAAPRNDMATIFLTGIPGLNQPKNVVAVGDDPAQHGHRAEQDPSPLGLWAATWPGSRTAAGSPTTSTDIELRALAGGDAVHARLQHRAQQQAGRRRQHQRHRRSSTSSRTCGTPHQGYASDPHYVRGSATTPSAGRWEEGPGPPGPSPPGRLVPAPAVPPWPPWWW